MSEIFLAPEEQRNAFASDKKQKKRALLRKKSRSCRVKKGCTFT